MVQSRTAHPWDIQPAEPADASGGAAGAVFLTSDEARRRSAEGARREGSASQRPGASQLAESSAAMNIRVPGGAIFWKSAAVALPSGEPNAACSAPWSAKYRLVIR